MQVVLRMLILQVAEGLHRSASCPHVDEDQAAPMIAKVAAVLLGVIPAFAMLWGVFSDNPGSN